jgi:chromatin structure-remodeling complex subunit RSC1/2
MDMMRLFERARRYFSPYSTSSAREELQNPMQSRTLAYGHTIALQRLYHALTSTFECLDIPHTSSLPPIPIPSASSHSFIPAGPGLARPTPDSGKHNYEQYEFTGLRIVTKDRMGTGEARWKGIGWKVGDYVHLVNAEDPSRPIIGQIFRSFVPAK